MNCFKVLIPIILFFACNANGKNENDVSQTGHKIKSITDDSRIIGNWSMCASFGDGQMVQYNVCPTIIFNSNGTGSKTTPNSLPELFTWTLKNKQLKLLCKNPMPDDTFSDTIYIVIFEQNQNRTELEIFQKEKNYTLYLAKQKDSKHPL